MGTKSIFSSHKVEKSKIVHDKCPQMSDQWQNILKLRSRIHKILDEKFNQIHQMVQKEIYMKNLMNDTGSVAEVIINEPKLEEWVEMFKQQILKIRVKNINQKENRLHQNSHIEMAVIQFPRPIMQNDRQEIFCHIEGNQLKIFEENLQAETSNQAWIQTPYEFPQGVIKRYNSITYLPESNQLIMIGGSKPTNPNIKSSKITSLNLKTTQLKTLSNLQYGISSHSAVLHKKSNSIYIIGGNKNYSIVSRGCFRLDLNDMSVQEISCLNYPVSSATCILWKQNWIYKFGGVGEAFGEWNTSPYIQRYSIESNEWEVINPSIGASMQQNVLFQNIFLANSACYICKESEKIFVFGGYSIEGEFKNYGFVLSKEQDQENSEEDTEKHIIQYYGKISSEYLHPLANKIVFTNQLSEQTNMFALIYNPDTGLAQPSLIHRFDSLS